MIFFSLKKIEFDFQEGIQYSIKQTFYGKYFQYSIKYSSVNLINIKKALLIESKKIY